MTDGTVEELAKLVGKPVDQLLEQFKEAGISKSSASDSVTNEEKMQLLQFLQRSHGKDEKAGKSKVTLRRKSVSELKISGGTVARGGRATAAAPKTVSVEVRKKRTYVRRSDIVEEEQRKQDELNQEREIREAEENAKELERKEKEDALKAEAQKLEQEKVDAEKKREEERLAKEQEEKRKVEEETRKQAEAQKQAQKEAAAKKPAKPAANAGKGRYGRKELHVESAGKGRRKSKKAAPRRQVSNGQPSKHGFEKPVAPVVKEISIPENITVSELAQEMAVKGTEVVKVMFGMGVMATINQTLDQDTAALVVEEMGHKALLSSADEEQKALTLEVEYSGDTVTRPPVVTVMGHVDHGKTSLLDYIRKSKVTTGEAGGITQHIGAYHVETPKGVISFIDTPGHAAFTGMRARGAKVTDIVILVVAADDGVMPQTVEAIQHAKAAEVPIIIAVNKIDKPDAEPDKVKNELTNHEIVPEEWGGDNIFVHVSALNGDGIDELLETISLQAELLELQAANEGPATGVVLESSLDKGRGPVATVLVQAGALQKGDTILCGKEFGRVRAMFDEDGKQIDKAGPSIPVVVLGLSGTPNAGDDMVAATDESKARDIAQRRQQLHRDQKLASQAAAKMEDAFAQMKDDQISTTQVLIKADVQGTSEAIKDALNKLSTDEVRVKIIGSTVGGITESDVSLAMASNAMIIAFNVRADASARRLIEETGTRVGYYNIIYNVIDDVSNMLSGMLEPEVREEFIGLAEVRDVFKSSQFGAVAGSLVVDGFIRKSSPIRVLRDNIVIYEGELESLRRFKDDVKEVKSGTECGIAVKNYNDVKPGDQIEVFERTEVQRTING